MPIHTVGDSHSMFGWNTIPGILVHHIGPRLCFSVGRDGIRLPLEYGIRTGDTLIFCFGEIDCRCHIYKYVAPELPFTSIIDTIVDKYFDQIRAAVSGLEDVKVGVYNVVPPIQKHGVPENPAFPYLGTDETRQAYVKYFNTRLRDKCAESGFLFVDVYEKYTDAAGFLNKELSDGIVHIRDGRFIKEFIDTHLTQ
jgi:hypothetical protein